MVLPRIQDPYQRAIKDRVSHQLRLHRPIQGGFVFSNSRQLLQRLVVDRWTGVTEGIFACLPRCRLCGQWFCGQNVRSWLGLVAVLWKGCCDLCRNLRAMLYPQSETDRARYLTPRRRPQDISKGMERCGWPKEKEKSQVGPKRSPRSAI